MTSGNQPLYRTQPAAILGLWLAVTAIPLAAAEFRIATKVYQGKEEKKDEQLPVSETVTLFSGHVVYDFLASPRQIAVFRAATGEKPGRFILLDPDRQLRTELRADRIEGLLGKVRVWAARQADPKLRFAAEPKFEETFSSESGELILASEMQTYRIETMPASHPEALAEYREFLDWYAKLNAFMYGGPPPQPRLEVNAALAKHGVVPISVELTQADDSEPLRAEHDFTWRLSREDLIRIDQVRQALATYKLVDNETFLDAQRTTVTAK